MRTFSLIIGLLAILAGAVWTLQGVGFIPGSSMSSNLTWVIIGLVTGWSGSASWPGAGAGQPSRIGPRGSLAWA